MKNLLIVEDEKLIRKGIRVILENSPLIIGQIFECKNGEQAWELLQREDIRVVLTDIKMPKMDGISLVKKINEMNRRPHIVVISGYDDFSFAVEMMRNGALDYILKPIDRNKLVEILQKIDSLLEAEQKKCEEDLAALAFRIMYYLTTPYCAPEEASRVFEAFDGYWGSGGYQITCAPPNLPCPGEAVTIKNVRGSDIIISAPRSKAPNDNKCGLSDIFVGGSYLLPAYSQSLERRKKAFFSPAEAAPRPAEPIREWSRTSMEGLAHNISKPDELKDLLIACSQWACDRGNYDEFEFFSQCVTNKIREFVGDDVFVDSRLVYMYGLDDVNDYISILSQHIEKAAEALEQESFNRQRMHEAVRFVRDNYAKPLNMAVVSNHVSMNYTLFSNSFKKYTGVNFVIYLRDLRIEKAKNLLKTTDKKIKEISRLVGYEDDKRFLKVFKQVCGISPKGYKMSLLKNASETEHKQLLEKGYELVFNDEFDYEGRPDSDKWRFDIGNRRWANNELQAYSDRPGNVVVRDGKLIITALEEKDGERDYTSARITSKTSWTHGYIAVSAKLPGGAGSWPAIWMLPDDIHAGVPWPQCGEIDIMEHTGRARDEVLYSLHSGRHNHTIGTQYTTTSVIKDVCERFHTYSMEWTDTDIEFFVDNISYAKYSINDDPGDRSVDSWPFNKPFYLIMNIAVGGTLGGPVDRASLPFVMEIDYVRVYQR